MIRKKKNVRKKLAALIALVCCLFLCIGCTDLQSGKHTQRNLEYTVVKEADIPDELMKQILEAKEEVFKLTYQDGEYLYIASGYGEQKTGGYSMSVEELYALDHAIIYKTKLIGPAKGEIVNKTVSYPYMVVKTEKCEEPVVFR